VKVLACVVSYHDATHLGACLTRLTQQDHRDLALCVVDNASGDGSVELARGFAGVRVVANSANRGFAAAANQAVAIARAVGAEALLVCNPDVELEPGYVRAAVAALAADPSRAAVQGRLWRTRLTPGSVAHGSGPVVDTTGHLAFVTRLFRNRGEGEVDAGQFEADGRVFGVSGAAALYRLDALDDVACDGEVFDEELFAFWEDVDLDWRLRLRGWDAWYAPQARGWHERGGAGPRRSPMVERLNFANRFFVVAKNDDLGALARALPGVVATSVLKAGELALTVPSAFVRGLADLGRLPRMLAKRTRIHANARVTPASVPARWFAPFDYRGWVAAWWRRVRAGG
jgi:GT2 family glycosyltransferase